MNEYLIIKHLAV